MKSNDKNNNKDLVKIDILDVLLDDANTAPIILYNDDGEEVRFEQIAVMPYNNDIYCILKPITHIENIKDDDEAIVLKILVDNDGTSHLELETNEKVAIEIFNLYYDLLDEELEKNI